MINDSLGHQRVIDQFVRLVEHLIPGVSAERHIGIVVGDQMVASKRLCRTSFDDERFDNP